MLAAVVALAAIAIHLPNLPLGKTPQEDAGVFLYAANVILDGGAPYRDVWDHKMPLVYWLDALGLLLAGRSAIGVWALQTIAYAVAAVVGWRALATAFGTRAALAGSAAWILAAPRLLLYDGYFVNFVQVYLAPLQFAALALAVAEARAARATWHAAALGATGAAAALLVPTGLGMWLAAAIVLVVASPRLAARRALLAAGAGLAVVAPAVLVLAAQSALADAIDQAIGFNATYARSATLGDRVDAVASGARIASSAFVLPLAALAWLAAAVEARRGSLPPAQRGLVLVALAALPLEVALAGASGRPFPHYTLPWLPALAVLVAYGAAWIERRVPQRTAAAILLAGVALVAVRPALLLARVAASTEDGIARAAIAHVRAQSAPGDRVWIWGSRAEVLVGADRRSPSRYVYQYAPLGGLGYASSARFDELLADLERDPPRLILDASADSPITPPLDDRAAAFDTQDAFFRVHPDVARLVAFVRQRYVRDGSVPERGWPVWRYGGAR